MTDASVRPSTDLEDAKQALQNGRYEDAVRLAADALQVDAEDEEALYIAAVGSRYARQVERAGDYLDRLIALVPEYGRAWQERAHLARDTGRSDAALAAYARAVQYNPALIASWEAQARLLSAADRSEEAAAASFQADRLKRLPKLLLAAMNLLHEGKVLKAEAAVRKFLQANPKNVEGMRLLADIAGRLGIVEEAEFLLESAATFEPDNIQVRLDYIQILRKRQNFAEARAEAQKLYDRDPSSPVFQSHLAIESMQTGDYETAHRLFETILQRLPDDPATLTSRGHALKTTGAREQAVASYRQAVSAKPDHGDAWYALANLKTYRFSPDEMAVMKRQEARGDLALKDRIHLCFALAKAHEDAADYEASFDYYERGNEVKRRQSRYDADQMTAELRAQEEVCTPELFARQAGKGYPSPDPIFILGLPRAGSTLLEQILASHSQIDGTLELPNILALSHRLRGRKKAGADPRYPQILWDLTSEQLEQFGRDFIENTRIHRQGAPFFIDKMPNNFRHIGLIHLILPNAKIIDARRAPMDCCFSGFKQLFAEGQEFTYGLREVGRYYSDYVRLMDHWDRVLPGKVLRVEHEDVLDDLEGQVRRMLDYIGVPFEEACLDFHRTERAVRTASSEQVRRPVNREGVSAWKPFEPWLDPLKTALGPLAP
ncbi:hypothetical protein B5C34_13345 [Pacificimonas flava]|uniref:Cytochrome c-type biogenesis protein H TPR domain-containing protein n=2 Tax=Pacificimonas TaxID=1960290 RepID=A0A219B7K2_9SPHN|nr:MULTISPECIES: tetratricopeptide repeat-containing sulfotransferase family protein [Pacificimonas]MBZ6379810.1 sulfotransferase [Pacificimonas aurantium]OWV34345.1 hypothetical protein B5C34_13345 [Pacificimonas flava]